MAYTFVDVHPERFTTRAHPDAAPMDTLLRVADAFHGGARDDIHAIMDDPEYGTAAHTTFHPELVPAGFQWKLAKVLDRGHGLFLELPAWLDDAPVEDALRGMYDALVLLYLAQAGAPGERGVGDFVALHTITALWGAEQVRWCAHKRTVITPVSLRATTVLPLQRGVVLRKNSDCMQLMTCYAPACVNMHEMHASSQTLVAVCLLVSCGTRRRVRW